jgi:hypothetical protein
VNLLWLIENATSAEITPGVGAVNATQGSTQVSPNETTTYRLVARNATSEAVETITVNVERPQPRIISFNATPATINRGDRSTLAWQTQDADTVTISGIGNVNANGTAPVAPTETTTYTITASNRFGTTSATAVVQVQLPPPGPGPGQQLPRIIRFTASPMDITAGQSSTVDWLVENADTVTISTLGTVGLTGNRPVSPTTNTVYTLTATNAFGSISSTIGLNVAQPPPPPPPPPPTLGIANCVASPAEVANPGDPVSLSFTTTGATVVTLNGLGITNPVTVRPTQTTTYTLIAYNAAGQTARCEVTARVRVTPEPERPIANPGAGFDTLFRDITLDASGSKDPKGLPLTYRWRIVEKTAVILDPNAAVTRVQLGEQAGPYIFELTVTNSQGVSSTARIVVNYVSTRVR